MGNKEPEEIIRKVVDDCTDCDVCRFLMDENCLMFPELYRLWDRETETGEQISGTELRRLVDLCNFCALCPCPNIRADIIAAKTGFIDRDGLDFGVRTIEDVERIAKLCGVVPGLANRLFRSKLTGGLFKKAVGVHPDRGFPEFPDEDFSVWAKQQSLHVKSWNPSAKRKVAYFGGCTGKFIFPDVAKAVVEVLRYNDIEVYYPQQQCCGMPTLLEGDRQLTQEFVQSNLERLVEAVEDGYDIVCSCPTCGFMLKHVLCEGAYYSRQYQESAGGDDRHIKVPEHVRSTAAPKRNLVLLDKTIYGSILKDDGYFSSIDPRKRILIAEHTFDVGEFLGLLHQDGKLKTGFGPVQGRVVYYPPCHQREQNIGQPYLDLLRLVPGIELTSIDGNLYCCGMGGIMGFKKEFHDSSIRLGSRLMQKIRWLNPDKLVTDCLSCRLQFNQMTSYHVLHPIEILCESYSGNPK
jgi:glycerol-3-phosphate dehydrogenase subunit C